MDDDRIAPIYLSTELKLLNIVYRTNWTAEDLCIKVCQQIGIGPLARHLFGLRNRLTKHWFPPGYVFKNKNKQKLEFRLRFKPSSLSRLKHIDIKAYDYYFHQARQDVLDNNVPDIVYERHKQELIGLGVTDMYRVMLEKNLPLENVESDYKKYIPKECIKRHSFFIKKPIHNALRRISGHDVNYVKEQYLNQFQLMAPNYPYDQFKAVMDKGVTNSSCILLKVNAVDIKYCEYEGSNIWRILCAVEDLCFVSIRQDNTVEISRKNGIPSYLKFTTNPLLMSFVSALDGYYRLSVKWTFNLCRDVVTPSLDRLQKLKCHGPVGGEFSYAKLEDKRSNRHGTYILRESDSLYNVFYIDNCGKDGKPRTRRLERISSHDFILSDCEERYTSITHCISSYQNADDSLYLHDCLPPSEYDKPPIMLCASERIGSDVNADEEIVSAILEGGPRCISPKQLQVYKAHPFSKIKDYEDVRLSTTTQPSTSLYRAMWRVTKGKKLEAAIKMLNEDEWKMSREFLELAGKWAQLRSGALVRRLYGITVSPAVGMVLELVKLGSLDAYLRNTSPQTIQTVDMVEAAACLANAVWHLEESGIIHGNIRCRKLLVHVHSENTFTVKLADPGLFNYTPRDVHWLPPECYNNPDSARRSSQADVWAVGTTMWQIFSRGAILSTPIDTDTVKKYYASGKRLPIPKECPSEVYNLMTECWGDLEGMRKQPQAIMRDINQILYQAYNSRRTHAYATAFPKLVNARETCESENKETTDKRSSLNFGSRNSNIVSDRTSLLWNSIDNETHNFWTSYQDVADDLSAYLCRWSENGVYDSPESNKNDKHCGSGLLGQMQGIFELGADCNVILQGRIGQGFYGEVFLGTLEKDNDKQEEPQQVAVKKLKIKALDADVNDFEREISIMKTLKHNNVVEILGVISEPEICLVMEFIKHGSLQSYLAIHKESLTTERLLGFALDIATGMEYLGRKNIVHRDLAARNILVASDNHVKISDFGLAQVTGNNDYYILQTNRDLPIKWYAPESLRDGKFSTRSDVWSFGVTMYETFSLGEDPKLPGLGQHNMCDGTSDVGIKEEGASEQYAALEKGTRLPCPPSCPQEIYVKIMYPCWYLISHERPNFKTLCMYIRDLFELY